MTEAFVALGANLGEPHKALEKALAAMDALEGVKVKKASSFYRTAPVDSSCGNDNDARSAFDGTLQN